jgi:hypothetical protein
LYEEKSGNPDYGSFTWLVARDVMRDALTDKTEVQREHIIDELERNRLIGRMP